MSNRCIMCDVDIPEGRQVCPICERWQGRIASIQPPPEPNVELSFGLDSGPNFSINYRRAKPLNKFQIWMFKICFGIRARNI